MAISLGSLNPQGRTAAREITTAREMRAEDDRWLGSFCSQKARGFRRGTEIGIQIGEEGIGLCYPAV
jgi:hypothetical protein